MNLKDIRKDFVAKVNVMRSVERLISSYDAEVAFETADESEIQQVVMWMNALNAPAIKEWIRVKIREEPTIRDLRIQAKRLGIANYGRMNKASLLSEIFQREQNERRINQTSVGPDFRSKTNIASM